MKTAIMDNWTRLRKLLNTPTEDVAQTIFESIQRAFSSGSYEAEITFAFPDCEDNDYEEVIIIQLPDDLWIKPLDVCQKVFEDNNHQEDAFEVWLLKRDIQQKKS